MEKPELRTCGRCGELKPLSDFAWRRIERGQRDNMCRPCRSAYGREHYLANREQYIAAEARRKQGKAEQRTALLFEYFRSHPCVDCGESDPMVLEFDHTGEKRFNIARGLRDRSWQSVLEEIAQCEVVCANCDRRRTARRGGSARALVAKRVETATPDL